MAPPLEINNIEKTIGNSKLPINIEEDACFETSSSLDFSFEVDLQF